MTTSGTAIFDLDMTLAIEEAGERAGIEMRGGYQMRSARRSINLLFADWSNRGVNMWLMEERVQLLTYGVGEYTLGDDIIDVIEQVVQLPPGQSGGVSRLNMTRVSVSQQATRTNPELLGRPTEIWYNRAQPAPIAHVWPLPGDGGPYTLVYTVLRRIEDAGAYTNTADMPFRFLPPFISGLAYYIAEKNPDKCPPEMIARLEERYNKDWTRASDEDREKATLNVIPKSSSYRVNT